MARFDVSATQDEKRGDRDGGVDHHPRHIGVGVVGRVTDLEEDPDETEDAAANHVDQCSPDEHGWRGMLLKEHDTHPDER